MAWKSRQSPIARFWAQVRAQHGVIARWQLLELGFTSAWIEHRISAGRLHPVMRGVYAVGRPYLTREGWLMAATLRIGRGAFLSHLVAGEHWGAEVPHSGLIDVSTTRNGTRRANGIRVHRRSVVRPGDVTVHRGIPITSPALTIVDLATRLSDPELERIVNEFDKLDRIAPDQLRAQLNEMPRLPGAARLRALLDHHAFVLTDSELERLFLPIARRAGLPVPLTRQRVNGFRVDFYWPDLGLVVETDGLRYHRTAAAQARDRRRDQAHAAAGLTPLRFTHAQIRYEPAEVERTLALVARRLPRRTT